MIVAHLSDLHLGHRAFTRTDHGFNLRERDLALAFARAMDALTEIAPDLVVISGDVFDRPDPPPGALVAMTRGLEALQSTLPETRVLMVAGARDTPRRSEEGGALAALDAFPNVDAATSSARSIVLSRHSAHVVLLPYRSALARPLPAPEPDPRQRWNLVVAHGSALRGDGAGIPIETSRWDFVALGGRHSYRKVAENAVYAGALERVGPSPWNEAAEEKGFVTADLGSGEIRFHPIPGRPLVALAPSKAPSGDPEALEHRIEALVREIPGGIEQKIVRLTLAGPQPEDMAALRPGFLADLVDRALHISFELETGPLSAPDPRPARARVLEALGSDNREALRLLQRVLPEGPRLRA